MSICCVFTVRWAVGLFLQGTFKKKYYLDFPPQKDPLKFYDRISTVVVSKVNIYQLNEGKKQTIYIQPLFKNFCRIVSSFISVPLVMTARHTLEKCVCCIELHAQNKKQSHEKHLFLTLLFSTSTSPLLSHPAAYPCRQTCLSFLLLLLPSQVSGSKRSLCHLILAHSSPRFSSQCLG